MKAKVPPIIVNIPNPNASNFKNKFQCFFNLEYKKKMHTPDATVIITYVGSEIEFGNRPITTSRIVPPATPVMVASKIIPTKSDLCYIALKAPVTAKAIVPNKSKT